MDTSPSPASYIMFQWEQSRGGNKQERSSLPISAAKQPLSTTRHLAFAYFWLMWLCVFACIFKHTDVLCVCAHLPVDEKLSQTKMSVAESFQKRPQRLFCLAGTFFPAHNQHLEASRIHNLDCQAASNT